MVSVFQLFLLLCLTPVLLVTGELYHLITSPQPSALEIGTNFTATCTIVNTTAVTVDDLFWNLTKTTVPKEQYTKVNSSALNVTIPIREDTPHLLLCLSKKDSLYVRMNEAKFMHGILLANGYPPNKPENLSCVAVQEKLIISPTITCKWETTSRQTKNVPTSHTLFVSDTEQIYNITTTTNTAQMTFNIYPNFMVLEIWVEARNTLGRVESEHLVNYANSFVKTNPPSDVKAISEKIFPSSLLINWTCPISNRYIKLIYQIRFCPRGSNNWIEVPLEDTAKDIHSFRLQNLQPDMEYISQVRCKYYKKDEGHWSDWSTNATQKTPDARPSGGPDLWRIITVDGRNERHVQFVCKEPQAANGRITRFDIRIQDQMGKSRKGRGEWESIAVNRSDRDRREIMFLKKISLPEKQSVIVHVIAVNSVGMSPKALMGIPATLDEHGFVQELRVWPHEEKLVVEWKPLNRTNVTEYVVEWTTGEKMDWQRESKHTTKTTIKGSLEQFVCYKVSVYPIHNGWIGKAAHVEAFLEEGVPTQAPEATLQGDPGRNKATLVWNEILDPIRRGFITHYTLFYGDGTEVRAIPLPANTTSYTLNSLSANTKYDVWIQASTIRGSKDGPKSYFTTLKYAPGEIEGIVVGVSLGLMFVFLLTMLLCIYKRDVIKENFWPQIPNPGESTIGNWSPDYSLKAETPKENCLSGISVLDMDLCDAKCMFEEDKASLALKKDKYLSEEHSSGIGGSSCMSSPRQSVSDSDEGGDMADTTASTVQYSSVVASSGYKGQTPSSQAQQTVFSRSESTQPLLDSEENPDVVQEGSRTFQRSSRQPCVPHSAGREDAEDSQLEMELQDVMEPLDFCPLEEDAEQTAAGGLSADWLAAAPSPASSYMPQGGYRPQ